MGRPNVSGGPLSDADYVALEARWISRELADAAFLRRVVSIDGAAIVGQEGRAGNYSGIVIPYIWPGDPQVRMERIRRDHPDLERDHEGALVGRRKYMGPPGRGNLLYLPASLEARHLEDAGIPLVVVEGEFKTLALWRLAWYGLGDVADAPAFVPIGLQGVFSWRGKVGRVEGQGPGQWDDVKGPVADLGRIPWAARRAVILFDTNVESNAQVGDARRQLTRELESRGAEIAWFRWPADIPEAINGIDDFLAARGPEDAIRLMGRARRVTRRRRVVSAADAVGDADWMSHAIRTGTGAIKPILANAILVLKKAPELAEMLAYDQFAVRTMAVKGTPWNPHSREWTDIDDINLADWMQHQGCHVSVPIVNSAVEAVARENSYHPVREYLAALKWDGKPRIDRWLVDYFGARDSNYTQAVGSKWLISAVARVMEPGCQADHCLILQGEQGLRKSTALRVMAGEWFTDQVGDLSDKDSSMQIHGVWIVEFGEMSQILSVRTEMMHVNAFIVRRVDRFRPPYGHRTEDFPRQCVFAGTVNQTSYLRDETGARRFWPIVCGVIDLSGLERERDQLWAEARVRYEAHEPWWLVDRELILEATEEQDFRYERDPWDSLVWDWMEAQRVEWMARGKPSEAWTVAIDQVLSECIKKPLGQWSQADKYRVGRIMKAHGMEYAQERVFDDYGEPVFNANGRQVRRYVYRRPSVN